MNAIISWLLILMAIALFAPAPGAADEAHLSLAACQRIALDTNPLTQAASEGVRIAQETTYIAKAPFYPEIEARAYYFRWQRHDFFTINNPNGLLPSNIVPPIIGPTNDYAYSIESRWTLYDWGERRSRLLAALAEQKASCKEQERTRQEILLGVTVAFYNLNANRALKQVAVTNLERAEKNCQMIKEKHAAGAAPLADVYRAEVEVAQGKQELVRTESLVRISKVNLNSSMGLPPDIPIDIDEKMQEATSPKEIDLIGAQKRAIAQRPEIQKMKEEICALKYRVDQAKSRGKPKLTAKAGYGKCDSDWPPADDQWRFGVEVEMPIFTGYAITHNIRRAKAELCQLTAEYERLSLDVQQGVWTSYSRLLEAYEMIQTSITQVQSAKESMRLTEARYRAGAGVISDLLDAQTALARAEATQVEAVWGYQSAQTLFLWTQGILHPF